MEVCKSWKSVQKNLQFMDVNMVKVYKRRYKK